MAEITPTPITLRNYVLKIPTDDYAAAVSVCTLTPKPTVQRFVGGKPGAVYKDIDIDWSLDLTFLQDWKSATSLSNKLWAAQGTVIEGVEFEPKSGDGPKFTLDILVAPGAVGGTARQQATSQVSLEVVGQPAFASGA